jgi:sugar phosphate isomerase/epimerase
MVTYSLPELTLGCTSFLVHEDYVPAFRFSASMCSDVSLLLSGPGPDCLYLATEEDIREIGRIADGEGTSINVHLPADGDFDTPENTEDLVRRVKMTIRRALPLAPHSWVLHINVPSLSNTNQLPSPDCVLRVEEALKEIATELPDPAQLCIENLETFRSDVNDVWVNGSLYSRCFDIGHVWKDGGDPAVLLRQWLPKIRICHLHGIVGRDHKSLKMMPDDAIDGVMHQLWRAHFSGAITMEVFTEDDLATSHDVLMRSYERYLLHD